MRPLTIIYVTARKSSCVEWFLDSYQRQSVRQTSALIVVDTYGSTKHAVLSTKHNCFISKSVVKPKPTIWQGEHRITKEDWWAKSNALNTGIALCETPWIAFVDDRCVLSPNWLGCVQEAMAGNYAVCGSYEKHYELAVENGAVLGSKQNAGGDDRLFKNYPQRTQHWYGGSGALPLEWCLKVNGFSEDICDSLGMEDVMFGQTLVHSGFDMRYDARMKIVEDRTPGQIDGALKRADKGVSPVDKSHKIVELFKGKKTSMNSYDLRALRKRVLAGADFPPPTALKYDWYDQKPVSEMV